MCPPEVTQEEFDMLRKIKAQQESRAEKSKVYRVKRNFAMKTLIEKHKDEYDKMMA